MHVWHGHTLHLRNTNKYLLKDMPKVIGKANLVVGHAPQCAHAIPEVASVHQL